MIDDASLLRETLPPLHRLAIAYAPAPLRMPTLALLALDARLAATVRSAREPVLAQLRLAWWRERLNEDASHWPKGEPLLAALASWRGEHGGLAALVDGWEALCGEAPHGAANLTALIDARGEAFAALAALAGDRSAADDVCAAARDWAAKDMAARFAHPDDLGALRSIGGKGAAARLPRSLRPLAVLRGAEGGKQDVLTFAKAVRLGLLGR